jgi:hypothetical protein
MPVSKSLGGAQCKGLVELRYTHRNVQYRPLGYYTGDNWGFVFLMMAREKDDEWVPRNACKTARARRTAIEAKPGRTRGYVWGN